MKVKIVEKSKMRSICMTDSEAQLVKEYYGSGSLTTGIRNMLMILDALNNQLGTKNVSDLVKSIESKFNSKT